MIDTTRQPRSGQDAKSNPRPIPGLRANLAVGAPALSDHGLVMWVDTPDEGGQPLYRDQSLMTATEETYEKQPLADDEAWGAGRFSPDGRTLLLESIRLSGQLLAIEPGRADSPRQLLLEGDLPSEQVRTQLLGWVDAGHLLGRGAPVRRLR